MAYVSETETQKTWGCFPLQFFLAYKKCTLTSQSDDQN